MKTSPLRYFAPRHPWSLLLVIFIGLFEASHAFQFEFPHRNSYMIFGPVDSNTSDAFTMDFSIERTSYDVLVAEQPDFLEE